MRINSSSRIATGNFSSTMDLLDNGARCQLPFDVLEDGYQQDVVVCLLKVDIPSISSRLGQRFRAQAGRRYLMMYEQLVQRLGCKIVLDCSKIATGSVFTVCPTVRDLR